MSKLIERTRKCCAKIIQQLAKSTDSEVDGGTSKNSKMGNGSSSRRKTTGGQRGGGTGSGITDKSSKLAARIIAPTFAIRQQSVNYVPQKNHRTPPRTPTRRNDRVIPAPEAINQRKFQRTEDNSRVTSYQDPSARPVRLYGGATAALDSFDEAPWQSVEGHVAEAEEWGFDNVRNWVSSLDRSSDKNLPEGRINDQWPCEIIDTDHEVIFTENHVYVSPGRKDEFQCYDLRTMGESLPPYAHSTPKTKKRVLFEKVDYAKYRQRRSQDGDRESQEGESNECCSGHSHRFSNGDIDRDEYGQRWCQDLLNWSREAAEYQKRHNQQMSPPTPLREGSSANNWFQEKFSHSSGSRYNKMTSGTEDSGVVCHFEDDEENDGDFWDRPKNTEAPPRDRVGAPQEAVAMAERRDSWETLKRRVFEPPEAKITPSRIVRDSEGRLLGRRCSCNSMCTSLCTLETWVDDETFDNNFNEELERRVLADGYGISRN